MILALLYQILIPEEFKCNVSSVLIETSNWLRSNILSLNCDKILFLQFLTKHQNEIEMQIITSNTVITNTNSTKFLGVIIDSALPWKDHITRLTSKQKSVMQ